MISKGFLELIELVKSKRIKKNVIVIFITDGVGDDKLEDYIENLAEEFSQFHQQEYQFKFFTIAVGTSFSHIIVAELKNRIHNSTLISSQMELIQDSKVDFEKILEEIKAELFYPLIKVEPSVSLVPQGKKLNTIAPNQTFISEHPMVNLNGKKINLKEMPVSNNDVCQVVNQIFLKLLQDNIRGLSSVKDEATKQIQIISELMEKVPQQDRIGLMSDIQETMTKIQDLASEKQQLKLLSAQQAAKSIADLQKKSIEKSIQKQQIDQQQKINQENLQKAKKKLGSLKKSVKIKTIFTQIEQFFKDNNANPQLLVKLLQEKKGGLNLQRYSLEYQDECTQLFELLYMCNN
ncbi:unnamed protein product [Paramecium sonneborni]|uniref:Uncharacterized protein n=1 Tax=Paramecium sonneborni TaxID=65129 RepID=A0A8S1QCH3_9CILI|nr:unnamed protein product [Paramecium sonneborni]